MAGDLAYMPREGNGEPAGRHVVSEQGFGDGISALLAGKPGFQNGRHMFPLPGNRDGTSGLQHQHDRSAGGTDGPDKRFLISGQIQRGAVQVFSAGVLIVTHADNGHIGLLRQMHGALEVFHLPDISEEYPGSKVIIGILNAKTVGTAGFKMEGHRAPGRMFLAPAVEDQAAVHIQAHAVLGPETESAVEVRVRRERAGPDNAEHLGIDGGAVHEPVEIHARIPLHEGRFSFEGSAAVIASRQAGLAVFIPEHALGTGNGHVSEKMASRVIEHFCFRGDQAPDALEKGHALPAVRRVVAEHGGTG